MKVPFIFGVADLRLCDVEPPQAGPRDVVIDVAACGICGTDLGFYAVGGLSGPTETPIPIGHELAGVVVQAGSEVSSVAVGDRVILNPLVNMVGNGGPEGGFGEKLLVRDVAGNPGSLLRLPDGIPLDVGALVEPLSVGAHAVNNLGAKAGDKVAIFGAGPIGLASLVVMKHRGIDDVVVFEPSSFRRERALKLGARAAFDPRETSARAALGSLHGEGRIYKAEVVGTTHFLEASGAPVIPEIVDLAPLRATVCVVSLQKKPVTLDFGRMLMKELILTSAMGYPSEFGEVLEMLQSGRVDVEPFVSHRFKGADFLEAFDTARQPDRAAKVLVQYGA